MRWLRDWLHGGCEAHAATILRDRDHWEVHAARLQKQHDELWTAYKEAVVRLDTRNQQDVFTAMLQEMFTEDPKQEAQFLTPDFHEREGLTKDS